MLGPVRNPLRLAVNSARQFNETIGTMFARIGNTEHPNGFVTLGYRNARRSMAIALGEPSPRHAARDVLTELKSVIVTGMTEILDVAVAHGSNEASKQLSFYDISAPVKKNELADLASSAPLALESVASRIDAQQTMIDALLVAGLSLDLILGDGARLGILRPGEIQSAADFWAAGLCWEAFSSFVTRHQKSKGFGKMAVAALDHRTTDCCLQVHGQTVDQNKPFRLTGTPRYADEIDWPPFHDYCRTSGVLSLPQYDDGLSKELQDAADIIQRERAAGGTGARNPADAFS